MLTRRNLLAGLAAGGTVLGNRASAAAARTFVSGEHQYPIRMRKSVEILYKSPEGHPNALEATPEGLWVGPSRFPIVPTCWIGRPARF